MMKLSPLALVIAFCASLPTACTSPPTREQTGMVIGGVLGGVVGSEIGQGTGRTTATILGTLIGSSIGGSVGRSMDDTDRLKTAHALENVRTGVASSWRNPDSGNRYTVVPTRTIENASGACREYTVDATIGGNKEKVTGTACRQADGGWKTQ
ncbi:MAG: glycine zipper 2TM domain-containing protein [Burkholderiales bacterium]